MKTETNSGERPEVTVKRLRERNVKLAEENKALKVDFAWLDDHVVRVSNPKDELIFFRAPGASPTRTYIAEARSAGESPNASLTRHLLQRGADPADHGGTEDVMSTIIRSGSIIIPDLTEVWCDYGKHTFMSRARVKKGKKRCCPERKCKAKQKAEWDERAKKRQAAKRRKP